MNLLEMNHIKKSFGNLEVLKDISLTVNEGEVLSIIGPSGSGKSTLLRCATMLETIDDGEIIYLGEAAAKSENGKASYAKTADLKRIHGYYGLVFQNFNLFPHYSVIKNITDAPLRVQHRNKEEVFEEDIPLGGLPQTGVLWWPVQALAVIGIMLFALGWADGRKKGSEDAYAFTGSDGPGRGVSHRSAGADGLQPL